MYDVVGCPECETLWIVSGRPEHSACPSCGDRRAHTMRTKFYTAEDADEAREARARLLAARHTGDESLEGVESFVDLDADAAGIDDETYLAASGVDPEAVAAAGERATDSAGSHSRTDIVREAIRTLNHPDADEIRAYSAERGVDEAVADRVLTQLVVDGAVSQSDGTYRLL